MKLNKKTIIIGISILLIVLIGIIIFYLYQNRNKLSDTKRVDGLVITNTEINYNGTIYILTAKVKNNTKEKKEDIKFKITFFDEKNKEITSTTGYLGDIESKKTVDLSAAVSIESMSVSDVKYEIIK